MGNSANPEFSRLCRVAEAFEERARRTRMPNVEAMTVIAFTNYTLYEPFRDELISKLRAHRVKYPPPESRHEVPRVFGFIAKPVLEYLDLVEKTAQWPHAWRIPLDGDRADPNVLTYILNPQSPRYFDSTANRVENFVTAPGALRLIADIRAHDWQPRQLAMA